MPSNMSAKLENKYKIRDMKLELANKTFKQLSEKDKDRMLEILLLMNGLIKPEEK